MKDEIEDLLSHLESEFSSQANRSIADQQKAYMRGQFDYYGMKSPRRREIQKPFLVREFLPPKEELAVLIKRLWQKPQRDFQLFSLDLLSKYKKDWAREDIVLLEFMIVKKSWWDTVDIIATSAVGSYFIKFPDQIEKVIPRWIESENIWLQRTCIIFQLKYKDQLDNELLSGIIIQCLGSKEFFINKAIGWALRQYSRTNPAWVLDFVNMHELSGLSRREALRLIN